MNIQIHETALVDKGADIGSGTVIWHWSHISSGSKIGKNVTVGQNVFVSSNAIIGDGCKIQNNVSIFDGVILEENVFCGPSMVFTNVVNPRAFINRKSEFQNTYIERGVTMGANCTIVCGVRLGAFSFVGAGAVITKDVKPYAMMVGVPARQIGWVSQEGNTLALPLTGSGNITCKSSGEKYVLTNGNVTVSN